MTTTASLAWDLADIAKSHLCGSESKASRKLAVSRAAKMRDRLSPAVQFSSPFIAAQRPLPRDVAYRVGRWLNSYTGTAVEPRLRELGM